MAVVHRTTLSPSKLELLESWLPTRSWYQRGSGAPELGRAGGFRLDDPEGEVGIEFMVVTDGSGADAAAYLVPVTYRGAPLAGAEHALIGTTEHGVLGTRWVYDGVHDPVLVGQLLALLAGKAVPQAQSVSNAEDPSVTAERTDPTALPTAADAAHVSDGPEATELAWAGEGEAPAPGVNVLVRRLLPAAATAHPEPGTAPLAHVSADWTTPDGTAHRAAWITAQAVPGI